MPLFKILKLGFLKKKYDIVLNSINLTLKINVEKLHFLLNSY